ncbi:MAG TPA: hypothetical protein VFI95_19790 [Terriglobales bacterium]|nr:hypothetical protein [Terriglobales bacterium]
MNEQQRWSRFVPAAASLTAAFLVLASALSPGLNRHQTLLAQIAFALFVVALTSSIDWSLKWRHPKNLVAIACLIILIAATSGFFWWRAGKIVAEASFNPGIAPFELTVRKVPVPVTHSDHFIITLRRGQYTVTSFRYFWIGYTPQKVRIEWPRLESFNVIFDERYVATCKWSWGAQAMWTMQGPRDGQAPGDQP